jgi:hypothetical protein
MRQVDWIALEITVFIVCAGATGRECLIALAASNKFTIALDDIGCGRNKALPANIANGNKICKVRTVFGSGCGRSRAEAGFLLLMKQGTIIASFVIFHFYSSSDL